MIERIKQWGSYLLGLTTLILGGFLLSEKRKTQQAESELASEKAQGAIRENEHDRQAARDNADALVDEYEKLRGDDR